MTAADVRMPPKVRRSTPTALWAYVLIACVVVAAFWPALGAEFVGWDDDVHLLNNPRFNPPKLSNVGYYWAHPFYGMYIPVTYTAWTVAGVVGWVDSTGGRAASDRLNPYVFHGLNVAVHTLSCLIVWMLLERITRRRWAALAGALLFAIHPLQVEAVAWVAALRDVLGGCLSFCAIYLYLQSGGWEPGQTRPWRSGRWAYIAATLVYLLAVLSKPSALATPVMAAVIELVIFRRGWRRPLTLLLPWTLGAIPVIWITGSSQPPPPPIDVPPWWQRPLVAGDALGFYLWKLVMPWDLCVHHGRTPHWVLQSGAAVRTSAIAIAVAAGVFVAGWKWRPVWAAGLLFVAGLLPVLGFLPFGFQVYSTASDRYVYPAMLGVALAVAALLAALGSGRTTRPDSPSPDAPRPRGRALLCVLASLAVLGPLGVLTYRQSQTWQSTGTLFGQVLRVNPDSWLACNNLAFSLLAEAEGGNSSDPQVRQTLEAAAGYASRGLQLRPINPEAEFNLGLALARLGRPQEAQQHMVRSLRLRPFNALGYATLAGTYFEVGRLDEAIRFYEHALKLDPNQPLARRLLPVVRAARERSPATHPSTAPAPAPPEG
jgi:tetratricopeptide (TPR) repeat protein